MGHYQAGDKSLLREERRACSARRVTNHTRTHNRHFLYVNCELRSCKGPVLMDESCRFNSSPVDFKSVRMSETSTADFFLSLNLSNHTLPASTLVLWHLLPPQTPAMEGTKWLLVAESNKSRQGKCWYVISYTLAQPDGGQPSGLKVTLSSVL